MERKEKELEAQVKDLLLHLNPMIHVAGSSENTFEMLLYLAEMDPTFHKLELVQYVRTILREKMTNKIEYYVKNYLEEHSNKMRGESPLDLLVDKVSQDNVFLDLKFNLEELLEKTVNAMTGKAELEIFKEMILENESNAKNKVSPLASAEASLNSSLNQSGFLFLHPAQYLSIAESLQKKQLHENLIEALNLLLAVTPGEPVNQEVWPKLRKSLKECLQSNDEDIFYRAFRFHSRILTSQVQVAVKEGFLNLLEAISGFWMSKRLIQRVLSKTNKRISVEENKLLQLMKMLIEFLKEFPLLWIRYPVNYVYEMIDALFGSFTIHLKQKEDDHMSFLDIVCLIDPKATWFISWTHGQNGRKKTFESLKNKSSILVHSLSYCMNYLEANRECGVQKDSDYITLEMFEFFKFSHSLKVVFSVLKYSEGRELFPVYDHVNEDHITIKRFLTKLGNFVKSSDKELTTKLVLTSLSEFCFLKETLCKIFCDLGLVDLLIDVINDIEKINKASDFKVIYVRHVLSFFETVNATEVGHEYLLTGKAQKGASKTHLTSNVVTPAQAISSLTRTLLPKRWVSSEIKHLSVQLSCGFLQSPLGRHLLLNHPLLEGLIRYLQQAFRIKYNELTAIPLITPPDSRPFCLDPFHAKALVEILLLSQKGVVFLERNSVLMPVLDSALPELARRGEITCTLLNKLVTSEQGCFALGKHHIVKPFWDVMKHIAATEPVIPMPMTVQDVDEMLEEALFPLLCLASTFQGINLLYGKSGLLEEMLFYLLDPSQQETEFYSLALKVLGMATSNLDGLLFLQTLMNIQEKLLAHQRENISPEVGAVIVDENSIMRSHILVHSFIPKGIKKFVAEPFLIASEPPEKIFPVHTLPLTLKEKNDKEFKLVAKKQGELAKFLNETRGGLHDSAWLIHCRRAFRAELSSNEESKVSVLMEIVEIALECLSIAADEAMPGLSKLAIASPTDIPFSMSRTFSNNVYIYPHDDSPRELGSSSQRNSPEISPEMEKSNAPYESVPDFQERRKSDCSINLLDISMSELLVDATNTAHNSFVIDMMIRYGTEQNLIPNNDSQRSNLIRLNLAIENYLIQTKQNRFDWFSCLLYFLSGGSVERTFSALRRLKALKVGSIIWPNLTASLHTTHQLIQNEVLYSNIIHCVKLVLFRDTPSTFLALEEIGDGIIWNLLSEWIEQSFIGVLPFPENFHMMLLPMLNGPDYFVYVSAALLLHVQKYLQKFATETRFKKIIYLQTAVIPDWKLQDHFAFMDSLSKRFRKIVLTSLVQPFHNLKYEYVPKQL